MVLTFYYDLMTQQSRALFMLLRANKIPYVECDVALCGVVYIRDVFAKINPLGRIPFIDNDGFILTESVAIAMYLCREYHNLVAPNWYPTDTKKQARVDEYLAWQHLNICPPTTRYFETKFFTPIHTNKDVDEAKLAECAKGLEASSSVIENVWLKDRGPFLCGDQITLADLFCSTNIEHSKMMGYNICKDRPNLEAWLERVRVKLNPHYDDANEYVRGVGQMYPIKEVKCINDQRMSKNISMDYDYTENV